jgi:hypothetical protein
MIVRCFLKKKKEEDEEERMLAKFRLSNPCMMFTFANVMKYMCVYMVQLEGKP